MDGENARYRLAFAIFWIVVVAFALVVGWLVAGPWSLAIAAAVGVLYPLGARADLLPPGRPPQVAGEAGAGASSEQTAVPTSADKPALGATAGHDRNVLAPLPGRWRGQRSLTAPVAPAPSARSSWQGHRRWLAGAALLVAVAALAFAITLTALRSNDSDQRLAAGPSATAPALSATASPQRPAAGAPAATATPSPEPPSPTATPPPPTPTPVPPTATPPLPTATPPPPTPTAPPAAAPPPPSPPPAAEQPPDARAQLPATPLNGRWRIRDTVTSGTGAGGVFEFVVNIVESDGTVTGRGDLNFQGTRDGDTVVVTFTRPGGSGTFSWIVQPDGTLQGTFADDGARNSGTSIVVPA